MKTQEQINRTQSRKLILKSIKLLSSLLIIQSLLVYIGVAAIYLIPFPSEMQSIIQTLKRGNALGIPGPLFTFLFNSLHLIGAILLYRMKKTGYTFLSLF